MRKSQRGYTIAQEPIMTQAQRDRHRKIASNLMLVLNVVMFVVGIFVLHHLGGI